MSHSPTLSSEQPFSSATTASDNTDPQLELVPEEHAETNGRHNGKSSFDRIRQIGDTDWRGCMTLIISAGNVAEFSAIRRAIDEIISDECGLIHQLIHDSRRNHASSAPSIVITMPYHHQTPSNPDYRMMTVKFGPNGYNFQRAEAGRDYEVVGRNDQEFDEESTGEFIKHAIRMIAQRVDQTTATTAAATSDTAMYQQEFFAKS